MTPPWSAEQVESLQGFQSCGYFHEFTGPDGRALIPTPAGWIADAGGPVVQEWAHPFMLDGTWKALKPEWLP